MSELSNVLGWQFSLGFAIGLAAGILLCIRAVRLPHPLERVRSCLAYEGDPGPAKPDPLKWKQPPLNAVDAFSAESDMDDPATDRRKESR